MMISTESNKGGGRTRRTSLRTIGGLLMLVLASFVVGGCVMTSSFAASTVLHAHNADVTPLLNELDMDSRQPKDKGQAEMLSCLKDVLWNQLPIAKNQEKCTTKDVIFAHHGDAGHWQLWNKVMDGYMKPMKAMEKLNAEAEQASASASQKRSTVTGTGTVTETETETETETDQHRGVQCSVWEVGANVAAADSRHLMKMYGHCRYHAFEPVSLFSKKLKEIWKSESRMKVHEYGIGEDDTVIRVTEDALQGESTFLADGQGGDIEIKIKTFEHALAKSDGIPSLLHINCEGCEWDFLPGAKKHGLLDKVSVIQIGWHSYGKIGLGARAWQLCEIRNMLAETHTMTWGLAFGWDRWELKDGA